MGIRVPRITLAADYDDESAFGDLSLLALGYGLHQAWVYATMFGAESVFGIASRFSGLYGTHISLAFFVSILVYGICLLAAAATDQRLLGLYVSKKTLSVSAALMCLGCLVLLAPPLGSEAVTTALEIVSGIATGIGSAMLIVFWGVAFARCDAASIVLNTAVAIVVGFGLYAFVLRELPFPVAGVLTSIIPLGELYILRKKTPQPYFERGEVPLFKPLPVRKSGFVARFGIPVFVFGLALGTLRQTSIQSILPASSLTDQALLLLAAGCATVLILITILALSGAGRWNRFFRPLVPFVAVTAFFLPMAAADNLAMSSFMLLIGYMCFEALMWIFFGELAQRFRLSPVFVFGLGRGLLAVASLGGSLLPVFATHWAESLPFGENTVIISLLVMMVVAYALLPDEREIEAIVIPCPLVRTVSSHLDSGAASGMANVKAQESKPEANAGAKEGGADAAAAPVEPKQERGEPLGPKPAEEPSPSPTVGKEAAPAPSGAPGAGGEVEPDEPSGSSEPSPLGGDGRKTRAAHGREGEQAESPEVDREVMSEARAAMYAHKRDGGEDPRDGKRRPGRFRMKCEMVANTFLLSRRETEVMFFLAKGHNSAYIQEKLYISEGTAKTHIRHIYRKLDVHTQQELMRLVESIEVPEQ